MRLSHSALTTLYGCGIRFHRRYIEREHEPVGTSLIRGTAVDRSVRKNLAHKISTGDLLEDDAVAQEARDAAHNRIDGRDGENLMLTEKEQEIGRDAAIGELVDSSVDLALTHHKRLAPIIEPKAVNAPFELEVQGTGITVVGYRDIIEDDGSILDLKTTSKKPSNDTAHTSEQLTMYALAHFVETGDLPPRVGLDYLVPYKTRPTHVFRAESTRSKEDLEKMVERIGNAADAITFGTFVPADPGDWRCSSKWCGFHGDCPFASREEGPELVQLYPPPPKPKKKA